MSHPQLLPAEGGDYERFKNVGTDDSPLAVREGNVSRDESWSREGRPAGRPSPFSQQLFAAPSMLRVRVSSLKLILGKQLPIEE